MIDVPIARPDSGQPRSGAAPLQKESGPGLFHHVMGEGPPVLSEAQKEDSHSLHAVSIDLNGRFESGDQRR